MIIVSHWSAPWTVLVPMAVVAVLHGRGLAAMGLGDRRRGLRPRDRRRRQQAVLFWGGLAALVVALASPLDYWSAIDFWPHMLQHLVLVYVAAPLVVLGAPWLALIRGLPARPRRAFLRFFYRQPVGSGIRTSLRVLAQPVVATVGFLVLFLTWHLPVLFDATLHNQVIHDFEHLCFFGGGMWLWSQLVGSYPYQPRWEPVTRVWLIAGVLFVNWMLAIAMAFARNPWYPAYGQVRVPHMGLLADQSLAAACMWVLPMIPLGIATFRCLNVWLARDGDDDARLQVMIAQTRAAMLRTKSQP